MNERGLDDDEWLKSMIDRLEEESKQGLISDEDIDSPLSSTHLQSMISRCLSLVSMNYPLKTRSNALKCLFSIACSYDEPTLNTFRNQVLKKLKVTLDDKKRLVRKEAVKAHFRWILIGQPGHGT